MFQLNECWSAVCDAREEYAHGGLAIGNVDNDISLSAKIVTGSLHGTLRVYRAVRCEYSVDHLLLECRLEKPILQLAIGPFLTTAQALAILHPRSICLYTVQANGANFCSLTLQFEHILGSEKASFTAYNFCLRDFGKASDDVQHLCVQSMDGRLLFLEQNRVSFVRAGNNDGLPMALCYISEMDSFVMGTADLHLECHRYQTLASAVRNRMYADWRVNLGELALEIQIGRCFADSALDILVLCEYTLFVVHPRGYILFQRRLNAAAALCVFPVSFEAERDHYLIAGQDKMWNIYCGETMLWSIHCLRVPSAICVASIDGMDGMLVSLDSDGRVTVGYLGTDPVIHHQTTEKKELRYEEMDEEHRKLLISIRKAQRERKWEPKDGICVFAESLTALEEDSVPIRVSLTCLKKECVFSVRVSIVPPNGVSVSEPTMIVESVGSAPVILTDQARLCSDCVVLSSELTVLAMYTVDSEQPRVTKCVVSLPFSLFCRLVPPIKDCAYKITLDTDQEPIDLSVLFQEFSQSSCNVMSFQCNSESHATILVSRNAGRYRIQSNTLGALFQITKVLVSRLERHFLERERRIVLNCKDALLIGNLLEAVRAHFEARKEKIRVSSELERQATQFRAIQRRLLSRYKDPSPKELIGLDLLFQTTTEALMSLSYLYEEKQCLLRDAGTRLSLAISLMLLQLQLQLQLSQPMMECLSMYLSPEIHESDTSVSTSTQGWEERTQVALSELVIMLTREKATERNQVSVDLKLPNDVNKLERLIRIVIDRLSKGARLGE